MDILCQITIYPMSDWSDRFHIVPLFLFELHGNYIYLPHNMAKKVSYS